MPEGNHEQPGKLPDPAAPRKSLAAQESATLQKLPSPEKPLASQEVADKPRKKPRPYAAFRISELPKKTTKKTLLEALRSFTAAKGKPSPSNGAAAAEKDAGGDKITRMSVAPDPVDPDRYRIATVTFAKTPEALQPSPPGSSEIDTTVELEIRGTTHSVKIDDHFRGVTPLYCHEPVADIVAVCGLSGHAFGSWRAPGSSDMWLRDYLPETVSNCRILTYGYNTALDGAGASSFASILDLAVNLVSALILARNQPSEKRRPLILMGHSLGGLVVKQALVESVNAAASSPAHRDLYESFIGALFFGVPNRGLNSTVLNAIVEGQVNERLIQSLEADSTVLKYLHQGFTTSFDNKKYQFFSYFEKRTTIAAVRNKTTGKLERTGLAEVFVLESSATQCVPRQAVQNQYPIDADHSNIVKFPKKSDPSYLQVRSNIISLVEEAQARLDKQSVKNYTTGSRPQNSLHPYFVVPYLENGKYTPRTRLDNVLSEWSRKERRVVLLGPGGVGKTQMALNLAFRSRDSRNVFWIDGSTTDNSISSIITIGKEVGVPTGKIKEQQEICQVVKRWLGSSKSGDWLIVVNNLSHDDDYLWEILSSERGRLVITTHQEDISRMRKALQVDCTNMTAEEAKTTFCKLSGVDDESSDDNDILSLVSNLNHCPLAIALAASFIHQTKCPVTEYINNYQQILPEHLRASENQTLRFELKNLPTPPIMATWEITFRHIERTAPFAADLLQLMSMLDYHNIPVDLLYSKAITEIGLSKGDVFETAMGLLHSFALVSTYKDHRYQLHDLIGIWTRKKMGDNARSFARVSLSLLEEIFGRSSSNLSGYLSHAKAVLLHSANIPDVEQQRAAFQLKVGQVLYQEGGYSDAEVLVKECIGFYKSKNANAIEVADCAYQLALIEEAKKAYGEAVDWYGKARDGFVRTLGQGHVRTLGTLTRIAAVSELQGCYADAIQNYEQALAWSNVSSSASHPFTIQTSHSMGLAFDKQGRYRDAMDYYSRALEGSAQAIGEQQPYTLDIQNNMAITLRKQGRYEEAYRLYEKILNAYHQTLGHKPHPSTLNVYGNMALIDDIRGRHQNATQTYKRVLEQKEKIFGEDHLSTISTVNNMSLLLSKQGKHEEAVKLSLRALEAYERTLGEDDPLALDAVSNCGLIYEAEGNIPRAGGHYEHAIMRKAIVLGMDHPSTLATLANWAGLLVKLGNHEEALALQDEVLRGYQSALGPSHPDTLAAEYAMAKTLERMQRYAEAKPHLTRVLEAYQKLPGEGGVARETLANIAEDLQAVDQKLASPAPLAYRTLA